MSCWPLTALATPDWVNILITLILAAAGVALTIAGGAAEYHRGKETP